MRNKMTPCDRCHKPTANISPGDMCNPCLREIEEAAKQRYKMRFAEAMRLDSFEWVPLHSGGNMRRSLVPA